MFSSLTIKAKLLLISLIAIVIVSISIAFESIYAINDLSKKDIESFRKEAFATKEKELKNYVSLAIKTVQKYYERTDIAKVKEEVQEDLKFQTGFIFSIIESEYKRLNGTIPEDELKEKLRKIVEGTRYGKNGYFWINDTDVKMIMHPIKPSLNGKNLAQLKDKSGKRFFQEFVDVVNAKKEGFVDYLWPKPGFEKPQPKVSFVKLFKPYNWIIGTGEYVSDVSTKIKEEALKSINDMRYGKDGYFWINDSNAVIVTHPIKPSLNGKNLSNLQDKAGKYLFKEFAEVGNAKAEGGLVKYMWPKPGFDAPQQKFSYVQKFQQWDWIIGTGAYVNDIEKIIKNMEEKTNDEINTIIRNISIFTLIAIILIYILYSFLIKRVIINPLEHLDEAIKEVSSESSGTSEIKKLANDEIGTVVDSFNAYIKKLQDGYAEDAKVIEEVEDVIQKVNNGFYVYKVERNSSNPQIMKLKESINSMIDGTNNKLEEINNILLAYGNSEFDYKKNADNTSNGIIGSLYTSTLKLGGTVSEFLSMITTTGDKLNNDTDVLSSSSSQLSTSANEQAASLEETAAAVEEITSIIKSSNEKVNRMSTLANDLNNSAKEGEDLASKTTRAMEDIDTQVNSINDAITVIDQIAFQTNILSLNAAVEAATAGEAGKGFAVVAQEVRNLASRSAEAAKEIKGIVEAATSKANEGKVIADNMIGGYSDLNSKISETIELISDVTGASKEQETGIIQINDAINSLDQATQMNAASASQISSLANEVSTLSVDLLSIAERAKFDETKKAEICDIDLVFEMSKLKNDHIIFKNDNLGKVGNYATWSVTSHNDCDFGKWVKEQETAGTGFTKTSNWAAMKECHAQVHNTVQEYINKNGEKASNAELESISKKLEENTNCLFKCIDNVKVDHCKEQSRLESTGNVQSVSAPQPVAKQSTPKPIETIRPKKIEVTKPTTSNAQTITANNSNDDDEWESF